MHGNYRHHYLLSPAVASPASTALPQSAQFSLAGVANSAPTEPHQPSKQPNPKHHQPTHPSPNQNQNQNPHPHSHPNPASKQHAMHQAGCNSYNGLPPPMAANGAGRLPQSKQTLPANYQLLSRQQQQQQQVEQNSASHADRLINSQLRLSNGRHFIDQQQQRQPQRHQPTGRGLDHCADIPLELAYQTQARQQQQQHRQQMHPSNHININNSKQFIASRQCEIPRYEDENGEPSGDHDEPPNGHCQQQQSQYRQTNQRQLQDNYASQIRDQLHHKFQQQLGTGNRSSLAAASQQQQQQQQQQMQHQLRGHQQPAAGSSGGQLVSASGASHSDEAQASGRQKERPATAATRDGVHVNFNRSNQTNGAADDEGDSRKKKYLTAKYGQQQMNLIKKRLKIEMWLYEHLQELAKGSGAEAELDEIDLDLDELLDMEDDSTRRRWLKKMLEPFEALPGEKIDKFIDEVLEQSKLL